MDREGLSLNYTIQMNLYKCLLYFLLCFCKCIAKSSKKTPFLRLSGDNTRASGWQGKYFSPSWRAGNGIEKGGGGWSFFIRLKLLEGNGLRRSLERRMRVSSSSSSSSAGLIWGRTYEDQELFLPAASLLQVPSIPLQVWGEREQEKGKI